MICIPIFMSAYYGSTDWGGIGKYNFIGFDNYREILFHDKVFWRSLVNALLLTAATVFLQHPFAILMGIFLTNSGKYEKYSGRSFYPRCNFRRRYSQAVDRNFPSELRTA